MGMFSSSKSREAYLGEILQQLNSGKTMRSILIEQTWAERAKLLLNIEDIRKCFGRFKHEMKRDT